MNPAATWDSHRVHHCHCDSRDGDQPAVGPVGLISGVAVSNPDWVGGYTGWDCSRRRSRARVFFFFCSSRRRGARA